MEQGREKIINAVANARKSNPWRDDPAFSMAMKAEVGSPVRVHSPEGEPLFWLVPLIVGEKACGIAYVRDTLIVTRMSIFGMGPEDEESWIGRDFFYAPPAKMIREIESAYPQFRASTPVLSYDNNPERWAWLIKATQAAPPPAFVFITPGGWYARNTLDYTPDRE